MRAPSIRPNLLAIVPPYDLWGPPAGAAALLAYLKAAGCDELGFLDLRLLTPNAISPTYRTIGAFGESFVLDIPDLPLVLAMLERYRRGQELLDLPDAVMEPFCLARGLNTLHLRAYLRRIDALLASVFEQLPDLRFIGFSVWTSNLLTTLMAAARLKRRSRPPFIVAGGPQVSQSQASAHLGLKAGVFDAVVPGEGEQSLLELYGGFSWDRGDVQGPVGGVMRYDAERGSFPVTERSLLAIQDLPLPDFDELHVPAYAVGGQRTLTYQLSRGCTDKCTFCSEWVFWRRFRLTGVDKALADVEALCHRWGAERILFSDSLLNGSVKRLREFAEGLLRRGLRVDWSGYLRAQIDPETAALLRRAGFVWAFVGVESLDDETLTLMNKRRTERQNLDAVQALLEAGVRVKVGLIPGFPGDSRERFARTVSQLRRLQAACSGLSVSHEAFVMLPGQPIYQQPERFGLRAIPWSDEVIDLAPALADVSRGVLCRVEGANQGLDRLGEYRLSLSLTSAAQPSDDAEADHRESLTPYALELTPLGPGAWLGRTLSPRGHVVGVLLDDEEQAWFRAHPAPLDGRPLPLAEDPVLGRWLEGLLERHARAASLYAPALGVTRYRRLDAQAPGEARLALGPLTVSRALGDTLWLAHAGTGLSAGLPLSDALAQTLLTGRAPAVDDAALRLAEAGLLVFLSLPPGPLPAAGAEPVVRPHAGAR
ncbi:MAG: B12-binding domain-containing radical SAM protein [Alphaproteobacteria bacterium]|nr:B12-binding domain-containing radical SAM protein [Alphaproteobacteria bacterium]